MEREEIKEAAKRAVRAVLGRTGFELRRLPPSASGPDLYAAYDAATLSRRPFLNVGAGAFSHPYWTNLDYGSDWYAEQQGAAFVEYDLTAELPLPFPDGSIELLYTSHTVEHVSASAVANLFREAHRVLRPGGGLRVTCPDARLILRTLRHDARDWWAWREPFFLGEHSTAPSFEAVTTLDCVVRELATPRSRFYRGARDPRPLEEVASWWRDLDEDSFLERLVEGLEFSPETPGDHICWWDEARLTAALHAAGFGEVYASRRQQSLFPPLRDASLFDTSRPELSLYVEALR